MLLVKRGVIHFFLLSSLNIDRSYVYLRIQSDVPLVFCFLIYTESYLFKSRTNFLSIPLLF
jgi:hypothetical protein